MASDQEAILNQDIAKLEEETKELAVKVQELVGVDCNSGACVFDPEMDKLEHKIDDLQKRKDTLEKMKKAIDSCEA